MIDDAAARPTAKFIPKWPSCPERRWASDWPTSSHRRHPQTHFSHPSQPVLDTRVLDNCFCNGIVRTRWVASRLEAHCLDANYIRQLGSEGERRGARW